MACAALEAYAGGVTNATVTQLQPLYPSELFVYVEAMPSGTPECGTVADAPKPNNAVDVVVRSVIKCATRYVQRALRTIEASEVKSPSPLS